MQWEFLKEQSTGQSQGLWHTTFSSRAISWTAYESSYDVVSVLISRCIVFSQQCIQFEKRGLINSTFHKDLREKSILQSSFYPGQTEHSQTIQDTAVCFFFIKFKKCREKEGDDLTETVKSFVYYGQWVSLPEYLRFWRLLE